MKVDYHGLEVDSSTVPRGIRRDLETLSLRTSNTLTPLTLTRKTNAMPAPQPAPPDSDKLNRILKELGLTPDASLGEIIDALTDLLPDGAMAPADAAAMSDRELRRLGLTRREVKLCADKKIPLAKYAETKRAIVARTTRSK